MRLEERARACNSLSPILYQIGDERPRADAQVLKNLLKHNLARTVWEAIAAVQSLPSDGNLSHTVVDCWSTNRKMFE